LANETKQSDEGKGSFFSRIKAGLAKTRDKFDVLLRGRKTIDADLMDDLETTLLTADVSVRATTNIIDALTERMRRNELGDAEALHKGLTEELASLLAPCEAPFTVDSAKKPYVVLVVGVNGVGKTTTIGKLAKRLSGQGQKVMLAAGDTFRAAAVEQLQIWGERNDVPVVAQHTGADSASVIFDAIESARARGADVLIADTAGRLQSKVNLMAELEKIVRVMRKLDDTAPHEVLLVVDGGTGQNALSQVREFSAAVPVSGLALTKLDGTAKGGVIFAIAAEAEIPVRFIGVGEQIEDLRDFEANEFVEALLTS